jgi:thiamine-monophosphate kinase
MRRSALGAGQEFDILRRILAVQRTSTADGRIMVGPGDDCAVVRAGSLAVSVDLAIEGVHFRRAWLGARAIGYRSATAALSDLAAMAAQPVGVLAAVAVPAREMQLAEEIAAGVDEAAASCGAFVLGGDLSDSPGPLVIDVVALGEVDAPLLRAGARVGDEVWVTGVLGGAAAAVAAWRAGMKPTSEAERAFIRPTARTAEARWLAEHCELHAGIDLSDGLAGDAGHIAAASDVAIVLDLRHVPVHAAASAYDPEQALALALGGGDDYELCITAAAGSIGTSAAAFERTFGIPVTRVGVVEEGAGVHAREQGVRRPLPVGGFSHFRERGP